VGLVGSEMCIRDSPHSLVIKGGFFVTMYKIYLLIK
jgi:hypothetical protein